MRFLVDMPVTDHEILEVARREGRVVVTADLDYPLGGVLGYAARLDLDHSIIVVDRNRIRHRRLPVGE